MPYLMGTNAIRRTIKYLDQGRVIFRKNVKVMTVHFNDTAEHSQGARDLVHWNLCQIMYKNPDVQVLQYKNMFPTAFVRCWLDTGEDVIMDAFGKTNVEIMNQLVKVLGQPPSEKEERKVADEIEKDISKFGAGCARYCICAIPGQVPCPSTVPIPLRMTGRYTFENRLRLPKGLQRF